MNRPGSQHCLLVTQPPGRSASWLSSLVVHAVLLAFLGLIVLPPHSPNSDLIIDTRFAGDIETVVDTLQGIQVESFPVEKASEASSTSLFLNQVSSDSTDSAPRISSFQDLDLSLAGTVAAGGLSEKVASLRQSSSGEATGQSGEPGSGSGAKSGFFGVTIDGKRVVFVVDASRSMNAPHTGPGSTRFRRVQLELINTIQRLNDQQEFFVTFFNSVPQPMPSPVMVIATDDAKRFYMNWVANVRTNGSTEPESALRLALAMRPDVIFFLTDGKFDRRIPAILTQMNQGRAIIHTVGIGDEADTEQMERIARANGGRYRFIPTDETQDEVPVSSVPVSSSAPAGQVTR